MIQIPDNCSIELELCDICLITKKDEINKKVNERDSRWNTYKQGEFSHDDPIWDIYHEERDKYLVRCLVIDSYDNHVMICFKHLKEIIYEYEN